MLYTKMLQYFLANFMTSQINYCNN